jgi:hypothetical protein
MIPIEVAVPFVIAGVWGLSVLVQRRMSRRAVEREERALARLRDEQDSAG